MSDDEQQPKPVTDDERMQLQADWEAYRVQLGANGAPAVLRAERRAFTAGWLARRHREEQ
jgi:hypothetical protein